MAELGSCLTQCPSVSLVTCCSLESPGWGGRRAGGWLLRGRLLVSVALGRSLFFLTRWKRGPGERLVLLPGLGPRAGALHFGALHGPRLYSPSKHPGPGPVCSGQVSTRQHPGSIASSLHDGSGSRACRVLRRRVWGDPRPARVPFHLSSPRWVLSVSSQRVASQSPQLSAGSGRWGHRQALFPSCGGHCEAQGHRVPGLAVQ